MPAVTISEQTPTDVRFLCMGTAGSQRALACYWFYDMYDFRKRLYQNLRVDESRHRHRYEAAHLLSTTARIHCGSSTPQRCKPAAAPCRTWSM